MKKLLLFSNSLTIASHFLKINCHQFRILKVNEKWRFWHKKSQSFVELAFLEMFGGVGETRTLAPVTRSTSLAGKPLHQLGYYSRANAPYINIKSERN